MARGMTSKNEQTYPQEATNVYKLIHGFKQLQMIEKRKKYKNVTLASPYVE